MAAPIETGDDVGTVMARVDGALQLCEASTAPGHALRSLRAEPSVQTA